MAELKRGYAVLLQAGDGDISEALADGIRKAMVLEPDKVELVRTEIKRQRTAEMLRRLAMCRGRTSEDWRALIAKAECDYGEDMYESGALRKVGDALLVAYAMVVLAFQELFEALGM